jgi:hypothetical protein
MVRLDRTLSRTGGKAVYVEGGDEDEDESSKSVHNPATSVGGQQRAVDSVPLRNVSLQAAEVAGAASIKGTANQTSMNSDHAGATLVTAAVGGAGDLSGASERRRPISRAPSAGAAVALDLDVGTLSRAGAASNRKGKPDNRKDAHAAQARQIRRAPEEANNIVTRAETPVTGAAAPIRAAAEAVDGQAKSKSAAALKEELMRLRRQLEDSAALPDGDDEPDLTPRATLAPARRQPAAAMPRVGKGVRVVRTDISSSDESVSPRASPRRGPAAAQAEDLPAARPRPSPTYQAAPTAKPTGVAVYCAACGESRSADDDSDTCPCGELWPAPPPLLPPAAARNPPRAVAVAAARPARSESPEDEDSVDPGAAAASMAASGVTGRDRRKPSPDGVPAASPSAGRHASAAASTKNYGGRDAEAVMAAAGPRSPGASGGGDATGAKPAPAPRPDPGARAGSAADARARAPSARRGSREVGGGPKAGGGTVAAAGANPRRASAQPAAAAAAAAVAARGGGRDEDDGEKTTSEEALREADRWPARPRRCAGCM